MNFGQKKALAADPFFVVTQQVIEMIQALPDESTIHDIMADPYFRTKVDRGLKELHEGQTVSHEAVKERRLYGKSVNWEDLVSSSSRICFSSFSITIGFEIMGIPSLLIPFFERISPV